MFWKNKQSSIYFIDIYFWQSFIVGAALFIHLLHPRVFSSYFLSCLKYFCKIKKPKIFDLSLPGWHHYVQAAAEFAVALKGVFFSAATFEPIQLYIICLTANQ